MGSCAYPWAVGKCHVGTGQNWGTSGRIGCMMVLHCMKPSVQGPIILTHSAAVSGNVYVKSPAMQDSSTTRKLFEGDWKEPLFWGINRNATTTLVIWKAKFGMLQRGQPWGRLVALIIIVQLLVVQGGFPMIIRGGYDIKDSGPKLHQCINSYFNNNIYIYMV